MPLKQKLGLKNSHVISSMFICANMFSITECKEVRYAEPMQLLTFCLKDMTVCFEFSPPALTRCRFCLGFAIFIYYLESVSVFFRK